MVKYREESDSLGIVKVPADRLWGAQTQRSLTFFSIGDDLMPKEMIAAYAFVKRACASVNAQKKLLPEKKKRLILRVCDELLEGKHEREFPLHVWMTGSGTQFNMNVNEVIANRISQIENMPLGSKKPVHPNDDVNMSQSTNDTFPAAMNIAAARAVTENLLPALGQLVESLEKKAKQWSKIVKLGRTHMQDATPLTLGQEFSGYVGMLKDDLFYLNEALAGVYELPLGGTAVGTGINAPKGFDSETASEIAKLTKLPFVTAPNKFAAQGAHNGLVILSGALKTLAVSLQKIANDIRLLACGPRAGFHELILPSNEPGSSIMPGKVNPTQCEALSMISHQVMGNDVAVTMGGAGGSLEMNASKPLMIHNVLHSIRILADGCENFDKFLVRGMKANRKQITSYVERSLMLVTALAPIIGYDKASEIAHHAEVHDLSLREAALDLGFVSAKEFDRIIKPLEMCHPGRNKS